MTVTATPTNSTAQAAPAADDYSYTYAGDWRKRWVIIAGTAALGTGFAIALWWIHGYWHGIDQPKLAAGMNPIVLVLAMAMVIERIIQPIAPLLGPDSAKPKRRLRRIKVDAPNNGNAIAKALADVTDARNKTAFVTWGFASGLACVFAAAINTTLLRTLIDGNSAKPIVPFWLDLLLTGLIVGAGTKPINDAWSRLQNRVV